MKNYKIDNMSDKAKSFIIALEALCIEHQVQLAVWLRWFGNMEFNSIN
jgi:hypothetical protein